jgi:outer membrane protein W
MLNRIALRSLCALTALVTASAPLAAQGKWEVGGGAGGSFYPNRTLQSSVGSATTGFKSNVAGIFWLSNDFRNRFGGEVRYAYQRGNATLTSGSTTLDFGAQSHQITYDFLVYTNSNKSAVRPYFLVGGGMKGYQGTGEEQALQPLIQYAALTKTSQWMPVVNVGAGIKWDVSRKVVLRFDVRDNMTQFPKDVILPVPPNTVGGFLHNIVPTFGIAYRFE